MTGNCSICFEAYLRHNNPPKLLIPCGHTICERCINNWTRNHNTCPICRKNINNSIYNWDLMKLVEENRVVVAPPIVDTKLDKVKKKNEIIKDLSQYSIVIIDNSGSMRVSDGKKINSENGFRIKNGVTRWEEAVYKVLEIAKYNISRNMATKYYLLNPKIYDNWLKNIDWVEIVPSKNDFEENLTILKSQLLDDNNIRGTTPLTKITKKILRDHEYILHSKLINYNIITDGNPDNSKNFENSLETISNKLNIFLTINLCTDQEEIIDYYNDLDKKIGNELSGLDVIDDFQDEYQEIVNSGNKFFTYTHDIHICRMAGCNSIIADLLDERQLTISEMNSLINELLGMPNDLPNWSERREYIDYLEKNNKRVFNLKTNQFTSLIDIKQVNKRIQYNERIKCVSKCTKWILNLLGL